jgi:serine phosphatase RsbU (regulator of sigma subunit)
MSTTALPVELRAIEKLREEELEEARSIQSMMLPVESFRLEPGDSVLFFRDGLPDAFDTEGESFGIERLQAVCETEFHRPPQEFLGRIFSAVEHFVQGRTQHDDMAAAIFHFDED